VTFSGLREVGGNTNPLRRWAIIFSIWWTAGLPPLGGFFAKIAVWTSMLHASESLPHLPLVPPYSQYVLWWILALSVLSSILSLYYYFQIFERVVSNNTSSFLQKLVVAVCLLAVLTALCGFTLVYGVDINLFTVPTVFWEMANTLLTTY
jgi:formate hydrogenlyase subunit 3/multisubunit Na+/H+ antiporter MnhD subunit